MFLVHSPSIPARETHPGMLGEDLDNAPGARNSNSPLAVHQWSISKTHFCEEFVGGVLRGPPPRTSSGMPAGSKLRGEPGGRQPRAYRVGPGFAGAPGEPSQIPHSMLKSAKIKKGSSQSADLSPNLAKLEDPGFRPGPRTCGARIRASPRRFWGRLLTIILKRSFFSL